MILKNKLQTANEKLIAVRKTFDNYNLISALHTYMSTKNSKFKNLLPINTVNSKDKKELLKKLENLKFGLDKNIAVKDVTCKIFK